MFVGHPLQESDERARNGTQKQGVGEPGGLQAFPGLTLREMGPPRPSHELTSGVDTPFPFAEDVSALGNASSNCHSCKNVL